MTLIVIFSQNVPSSTERFYYKNYHQASGSVSHNRDSLNSSAVSHVLSGSGKTMSALPISFTRQRRNTRETTSSGNKDEDQSEELSQGNLT